MVFIKTQLCKTYLYPSIFTLRIGEVSCVTFVVKYSFTMQTVNVDLINLTQYETNTYDLISCVAANYNITELLFTSNCVQAALVEARL